MFDHTPYYMLVHLVTHHRQYSEEVRHACLDLVISLCNNVELRRQLSAHAQCNEFHYKSVVFQNTCIHYSSCAAAAVQQSINFT